MLLPLSNCPITSLLINGRIVLLELLINTKVPNNYKLRSTDKYRILEEKMTQLRNTPTFKIDQLSSEYHFNITNHVLIIALLLTYLGALISLIPQDQSNDLVPHHPRGQTHSHQVQSCEANSI